MGTFRRVVWVEHGRRHCSRWLSELPDVISCILAVRARRVRFIRVQAW